MRYTIEQFAADCHAALKADPGTAGRQKVRDLVAQALKQPDFIATYIPDGTPERHVLYEDPELGFTILAHGYTGAKSSKPHDHGPSWAIYGQADGETIMSDWELLSPPNDGQPGKVRLVRNYKLKPGAAYVYNEGDLHSPRREGSTRLIRIEGRNVEKIKRLPYEVA